MAKFWTEILVPVAVVGAIAAQTLGVEISRAGRLHAWFPQIRQDTTETVIPADTLPPRRDSVKTARADSLSAPVDTNVISLDDEELLFYEEASEQEDTVPKIFARDTMKVPDSLRTTDPFLYEWYVAIKDSYTHRLVVDSLREEGDSLIWPRIDSLFLADSALQVQLAWERKWNSMSKMERKRWIYENVTLPATLHRQDSILHRKDSIKRRRDSIIENTPRVLETAFLPESLHYKRLVTWRHDRLFNKVETFEWDTTADYHFYDYPFLHKDVGASWLGMPGSAVQEYNFFRRNEDGAPGFYAPYESWTYNASNLPMFNTKTPYTELEYYGNLISSSTLSADAFRVFTTQNILPSLNIALEMKRYGGAGTLKNEQTNNRTYFVAGNYLGKNYLAHAGFIYNSVTRQESGGVQDNMWIRDTTVDVREIEVNFANASNRYRKTTVFYDQSYRIPFDFIEEIRHRGDTTWVKSDSLNLNMPTGFIGTTSEYTLYGKKYVDNTSATLSAFYNDVFNINPGKSRDSLQTLLLDNRLFVRLQPWRENALLSKVEAGIGDRYQSFHLMQAGSYLHKSEVPRWNSVYAYGGAEGKLSRYLDWDASALLNFAGTEAGDFYVKANAVLKLYPFRRERRTPLTLSGHFETSLKEPEFYTQHFYSNHYAWENHFSKVSTTKIEASLNIPQWRLRAHAGYALLANNIYYDTLGIARQNREAMSVLSAGLSKDFVMGPVHLENKALLQLSSQPEVMPLPLLALNLRWYVQFIVVSPETMKLQLGANARYTTQWYAPSFNPVSGTFMNQKKELYGNCPVFDLFVNAQWKKVCVFVKMENMGNGWPMKHHDYFTAHQYIQTARVFKFGISWPFYPRMGENKALSSRASSGIGGGGGGGLGDIKGALNGLGGR